jgi:hypothetical protein
MHNSFSNSSSTKTDYNSGGGKNAESEELFGSSMFKDIT